jgi:hypothetical protein
VGPKFKEYLFNEHNPHKLLQILQHVAKPSKAALRQLLEADLERLEIGPKRLGVESWLNLYVKILTKGKRIESIDDPLPHTTFHSIMRGIKSQQAEEGELKFSLEELINKFNITYRPPKIHREAFATFSGESMDDPIDRSYQRQGRCSACNGRPNVEKCRNLFEELRPDGWLVQFSIITTPSYCCFPIQLFPESCSTVTYYILSHMIDNLTPKNVEAQISLDRIQ